MRASTLKETIKSLFPIQRTLCVEGAPGGGKTSIVHEAAAELGVPCVVVHMPLMCVEDFGIPFPKEGTNTLCYKLSHWYPQKGVAPDKGILLFDDRNQASADLQKVVANICQARVLHGVEMPEGWMVISTGNRQEDKAGANKVLTHLRNRETVVQLDTDVDDWCAWALDNGVKEEVVAFIKFRPDLLHNFDPQAKQNPTPRSWVEGVSEVLGVVPEQAEFDCFCGAVGEGAAVEFTGFIRTWRSLPDIDECIKNPTTAPIADDAVVRYALAGAISRKATPKNLGNIITYFERMPREFLILTMTLAGRRNRALVACKEFAKFCQDNMSLVV